MIVVLISLTLSCNNDNVPEASVYTISVKVNNPDYGKAFISSNNQTSCKVGAGQSVTLVAQPAQGFSFQEWEYEGKTATSASFTVKNIMKDMTFVAVFNPDNSQNGENDEKPAGTIVFEDDFEQESNIPDPAKWQLCDKGSSAWCTYMSESYDQAYVKDGKLVLIAENVDGEYKAGGIRMLNELGFQYGIVEVSARFTKTAQGSWPAIWMMPSKPVWSGWPQCGEIDIMEHLNNDTYYWSVIHTNYTDNYNSPCNTTNSVDLSEFNTYGIEWTSEVITFYFNGKNIGLQYRNRNFADNQENSYKQWPFDAPFYLILNNALGGVGTWPGAIDDSQLPAIFEIDWVKVTSLSQ